MTVLAGLLIFAGVLAPASEAGAAAPTNLADIDVALIASTQGHNYVVGAITQGGSISVETIECAGIDCATHGWTSLGGGFTSVTVERLYGNVVVIGRRTNGATWYRRAACSGATCSWAAWRSLGGNVARIAAGPGRFGPAGQCVTVAGRTSTSKIYSAEICPDTASGWRSTGGKLTQAESHNDLIFGTSTSGQLWVYGPLGQAGGLRWTSLGGRVSQPVRHAGLNSDLCGLAASKQLWCFSSQLLRWQNHGGRWRSLDDGQTIGLSSSWQAWAHELQDNIDLNHRTVNFGGSVNQVAWDRYLVVGVGGDYRPWYHATYLDGQSWYRL